MNLKEYVELTKLNVPMFAKKLKLSKPTLYRIMAGGAVSIYTAQLIIDATHGAVTLEDLVKSTKLGVPEELQQDPVEDQDAFYNKP